MSDDGRLSRAGIVAALGHVVAIYLAARVGARALDAPPFLERDADADLVAVEMWVDAPPPAVERRAPTHETEPPEASPPSAAGATRAEPARGVRGDPRNGAEGEKGEASPGSLDASEGFSSLAGEPRDPTGLPRLSLSDLVDMSLEGPPAPTKPPLRRVVTADDSNEAVRSLVRHEDKKLGLGNPQETAIAAAVQEAGRASGVPSGTRFVVTILLDGAGNVTDASIRGDTAGDGAWRTTLAAIRGKLSKPVPLGIDERGKGARVTVNATLLHVFPSGSDKAVVMGDCPQMPLIGGEQAPHFMNIGGEQYLEPPNGICALSDGDHKDSSKTIVVRTSVKTHHAGEAPPALSSFPPRPRPKKLPTPMELIMRAITGK